MMPKKPVTAFTRYRTPAIRAVFLVEFIPALLAHETHSSTTLGCDLLHYVTFGATQLSRYARHFFYPEENVFPEGRKVQSRCYFNHGSCSAHSLGSFSSSHRRRLPFLTLMSANREWMNRSASSIACNASMPKIAVTISSLPRPVARIGQ